VVSGTGSVFQVTATGAIPITYSLTGQPAGVSINSTTGLITIAATTAVGSHAFAITATNSAGSSAHGFTLIITSSSPGGPGEQPAPQPAIPPTITSANSTSVVSGTGSAFQVTATGAIPITYSLTGQPTGVIINSVTGLISIAAITAVGSHTFTITATNDTSPAAMMSFTLLVRSATEANDQIQRAYIAFFNRPADVPGLTYWKTYPGDMQGLLDLFAQSEEYLSDFHGLNNTQILTMVYQHLFGRDPEPVGLAYWSMQMNMGWITIANVAYEVLGGARNEDFDIINNKVRATNMFTATLNTPQKVEAYNNAGPMGLGHLAKKWLAGVNEHEVSVVEAEATLNALVNKLVAGNSGG
jgi:hypothetical protein